ncbi:hypothetical protein C7271_08675 [filamentous cyanobacterium CCP5]|nr:hypothetical protein C7271_08675 [filamentous cyanobacterium CCP5]
MSDAIFPDQDTVRVQAVFLGQRIDLRLFEGLNSLADSPLIVETGDRSCAVLFDYGVVVMFGQSAAAQAKFLQDIEALIADAFDSPATESVLIRKAPVNVGKVEAEAILLSDFDVPCLQIVAEVMAKSVVLDHYEIGAAEVFDQVESFAASLHNLRQNRQLGKELLKQIGNTLLIQNKIVGRVEISDKPELLWEYPEFDRLYLRLEDEYEIRERLSALERKLEIVSRTAETALELQQHNTSLRLEVYVVVLIVIEVLLSFYDLIFQGT